MSQLKKKAEKFFKFWRDINSYQNLQLKMLIFFSKIWIWSIPDFLTPLILCETIL